MDAFYAAVEQHDHPELRGQPVIVGATSPRGVVLTASYEARRFGVHSAMPAVRAHQLCPHGLYIRPRMRRYAEVARRIRQVFHEFTPLVEPLSLDEAFLDVTASLALFESGRAIAERLKDRVRAETGLTASVGIAPNKLIAKIASAACKPDGVLEVPPAAVADFLRPLPVGVLWGAGPKAQEQLHRLGINTIGDLLACNPERLRRHLGSFGPMLRQQARGVDDRPVNPDRERKSFGEESTFDRDRRDGPVVRQAILRHSEAIARRLRAEACRAQTVALKMKLAQRTSPGKYPVLTRRVTLAEPTDDGATIARAALTLWAAMPAQTEVRLIGVALANIEASAHQLALFSPGAGERRRALNRALDAIARRFGDDAVVRADLVAAPSARRTRR